MEYYVVTNIIGVINVGMRHFIFFRPYLYNMIESLSYSEISMNIGLLLGILTIIVVLVVILLILLLKSLNNIKALNKNIDTALTDNREDRKPLTDDTKDTSELRSNLVSYFDKVISINDELEPFGFAFDPDNGDFYSIMYPWQRQFGYCSIYDEAAPALSLIYDTEPIYFDYNGKHWLIQFWKGQYGITTGGEIGVYNTTKDEMNIPGLFKGRFYSAVDDEERLEMSFSLVKNGELLTQRSGLHWWLTSFILGEFSYPEELTMYIEINFPTSSMRDSFIEGLIEVGYTNNDFSTRDNTVYIVFDSPYSRQPYTKTSFTEELMQENNRRNVDLFSKATDSFTNIIDKLYLLRQESPDYYNDILRIGKPKKLFAIYNAIKKYLD